MTTWRAGSAPQSSADMSRDDRRRVRWFFAGLLVVSAFINLLGTLLVHHQSRTALLESLLPSSISLGGRTGVVLSSLCLLFLARGVARGKRVAWQLTCALLVASIAFDLVKDIDLEDAILAGWILCGLWWLRSDFTADSNPTSLRRGFLMFGAATMVAALYAIGGALVLGGELSPGFGVKRTLEHQVESMLASPVEYTALTHRAAWFLDSLPVVTYGLVIVGLLQLLRPAIAPRPGPTDRDDAENLVERWGRNRISRLALYGPTSYYRPAADSMVPFTLQGRTALVLGDPVGDPRSLRKLVEEFSAYCERQDWIPAFYQVDDRDTYRSLGMALVRLGSEAMLRPADFTLASAPECGSHFTPGPAPGRGSNPRSRPSPICGSSRAAGPSFATASARWPPCETLTSRSRWRPRQAAGSRDSRAGCPFRCARAGRST